MKLDNFTSADICKIIKECSKSGVSCVKLGDLFVIQFGHTANLPEKNSPEKANQDLKGRVFPPNEEKEKEVADLAEIAEKGEFVDETVANLNLTDPYEWEQQEGWGELEDAEKETARSDQNDHAIGDGG